jgi:hypothetical protein
LLFEECHYGFFRVLPKTELKTIAMSSVTGFGRITV